MMINELSKNNERNEQVINEKNGLGYAKSTNEHTN